MTTQLSIFDAGQPLEEIEQLPAEPMNPRWLLYVSARGGSVESGGRGDNARFMGWVSREIVEYRRATGRTPMHDQTAFTDWMRDNTTPGELAPAMREDGR